MRIATLFLCVCLIVSLGVPLLPAGLARADDLSDAQATLSNAEAQLTSIANEYNEIQGKVAEVETKIESTTNKAKEAQQAMLEGQQQLGEVMVSSYKNEAANSLVNVFLASDSLESFIRNVTYYNSIEQQKAEQIAEHSLKNSTPCLKSLISKRTIKKSLLRRLKPKKNKLSK